MAVAAAVGLLATLSPPPAAAQDPRLQRAEAERAEVQQALDAVLQRQRVLQTDVEEARAELDALVAREAEHREAADAAKGRVAEQVRASYRFGMTDPALTLIASDSPQEAAEQARLLGVLSTRTRAQLEVVGAARVRTEAAAQATQQAVEALAAREAELADAREEAAALVTRAEQEVAGVKAQLAREQAERERREREAAARAAAERRAQAAAASRSAAAAAAAPAANPDDGEDAGDDSSDSGGSGGGSTSAAPAAPAPASAPASGGVACPVGSPRNYSDTWGAPRSGGRSHKGTDILAPYGTPVYAIESGTISRLNNSSLGGISLYLAGDSGNVYYYTHLSGYNGVSVGQHVSAGQHIASNGDSGNAAGIPHVHFEVSPGGGGSVNPYPYVKRACG